MTDWRPAASLDILRQRARMLQSIRAFFSMRGVMEVETPILSSAGTTDPAIESYALEAGNGRRRYLHTSPEFPMKRLLAAGSGDIYQLARVFRADEQGRMHNPEFTLLEWYRLGMDHHALMDEVVTLIRSLAENQGETLVVRKIRYAALCRQVLAVDPFSAEVAELQQRAQQLGIYIDANMDRDGWLDLLLSHIAMPSLPANQLTLLYDYPASQASLARLNPDGVTAARFEVFWGGVELANGFYELQNAREQEQRFRADQQKRQEQGQPMIPLDKRLIEALKAGMPACAGVAMGVDRLLMKTSSSETIHQVLAFSFENA